MLQGQPIWAKLFFMIRTGHVQEALQEAIQYQSVIENREPSFVSHLKTWAESLDRRSLNTCETQILVLTY